jgi:hypothetical protein
MERRAGHRQHKKVSDRRQSNIQQSTHENNKPTPTATPDSHNKQLPTSDNKTKHPTSKWQEENISRLRWKQQPLLLLYQPKSLFWTAVPQLFHLSQP